MNMNDYVSILLLFGLCLLGTFFKVWDYVRVRHAV